MKCKVIVLCRNGKLIRHVYLIALYSNPQPASFILSPLSSYWGEKLVSYHRRTVVGIEQGENYHQNLNSPNVSQFEIGCL